MTSPFKLWCKERGFNTKKGTSPSHVLMDGGRLSVPFDKVDLFYERYIQAVNDLEKVYVVEQKTDIYNYFVDVDYIAPDALTLSEIKEISVIICNVIPGDHCIISTSRPKPKKDMTKTGIHINWNPLPVNKQIALALMHRIIQELNNKKPNIKWGEIIDSSVYTGSGFRLPWSHKMTKHPHCNGKECPTCVNGKIIEGAYYPIYMYDNNVLNDIPTTITIDKLKFMTVRTDCTDPISIETPEQPIKQRKPDKKTLEFFGSKIPIYAPDLVLAIQDYVNKEMTGQDKATIVQLYMMPNDNTTIVASTGSRYCENIRGEHSSNHVYFVIDVKGKKINQKCHCTKRETAKYRNVVCNHFKSSNYRISSDIMKELNIVINYYK